MFNLNFTHIKTVDSTAQIKLGMYFRQLECIQGI